MNRFGNGFGSMIIIGLLGGCSIQPVAPTLNTNIVSMETNGGAKIRKLQQKKKLKTSLAKPNPGRVTIQPYSETFQPISFLNQTEEGIAIMLGVPAFYRAEATARVWQYRIGDCVLDIVFYSSRGEFRVTYYEFRHITKSSVFAGKCHTKMKPRRISQSIGVDW